MNYVVYERIKEMFLRSSDLHDRLENLYLSLRNCIVFDDKNIIDIIKDPNYSSSFELDPITFDNNKEKIENWLTTTIGTVDNYSNEINDFYHYFISVIQSIYKANKDMIPSDPNATETRKELSKNLVNIADKSLFILNDIDKRIQKEIITIAPQDQKLDKEIIEKKCYNLERLEHVFTFLDLCRYAMTALFFSQIESEFFYGSEDKKAENEALLKSLLSSFESKLNNIENITAQSFKTIDRKTDQLLKGQEETQRKIVVQGDQSSRENKKLEDKITKRNQKESRNELTQMDCAIIIARIKNTFNKQKRDLLIALRKSTEKIKDVDAENIKRTIEGWDVSKPRPPAGYSRRISEYEFEEWAKKREARKFENWRVKLQKSLKTVSVDTMREDEVHARMEQDHGDEDDFCYFDENEKK